MTEETQPEIRWLGNMQRLKVEPGDVFVLHCDRRLTLEQGEAIQRWWQPRMPGLKLLVVDAGMKLGVMQVPNEPKE